MILAQPQPLPYPTLARDGLFLVATVPRNNNLAMPSLNLDSLPFDVFYQIATSLDDCDYVPLSRTNRAIHALMTSDLIAHKIVTVS